MAKLGKKRRAAEEKVEKGRDYSVEEAAKLIKEINTAKFDASIDCHVRLGVDPRKADQAIRGTVSLPHGTGKSKTVLVFCNPEDEEAAKAAGADHVGLDEFVKKVEGGWTDIDVIIASPKVMPKIARLGRTLGPRGLMPNPKSGTVTTDIPKAVEEVKKGKIAFKIDKFGIIHASIGRVSFSSDQIRDNAQEFLSTLMKLKPSSAKGIYMKNVTIASTMSPGISIDTRSLS